MLLDSTANSRFKIYAGYPTIVQTGQRDCIQKPETLISDGAPNFRNAFLKQYRTLERESKHIQHIRLQGDYNNNKMERLNGEIRDREKTMRGQESRYPNSYMLSALPQLLQTA
jgi:transposase-like protein